MSEDAIRELVRTRIKDLGLDMRPISERIGKNVTYIQQFLTKGVPRRLPEDVREKLAPILEVEPDQLKPGTVGKTSTNPIRVAKLPPVQPGDKVPIMGIAEGGPDGHSLWNGEVIGRVDRHPNLVGVTTGYAIYVTGTSMVPRYEPGEILHVNPIRPPSVGNYVLIQLKPEQDGDAPPALVKKLIKRTASKLTVEQFNPAKTFDISTGDILTIHKIVGSSE
jgi:phage repressor protein C with HTH and peptisase S24 domain